MVWLRWRITISSGNDLITYGNRNREVISGSSVEERYLFVRCPSNRCSKWKKGELDHLLCFLPRISQPCRSPNIVMRRKKEMLLERIIGKHRGKALMVENLVVLLMKSGVSETMLMPGQRIVELGRVDLVALSNPQGKSEFNMIMKDQTTNLPSFSLTKKTGLAVLLAVQHKPRFFEMFIFIKRIAYLADVT
ncbi:hypothetical protein VNO77_33876 [Canavalia gladiata]|uniref:Uncharacterized protein n=1 Tax=Canavalia gladiata TaxID=3824 RepID=A0AAN9PY36_CANGL